MIPDDSITPSAVWALKFVVFLIILFPYLLLRLTASFAPFSRRFEIYAAVITFVTAVLPFAFDRLPRPGEEPTIAFRVFIVAVLVQWISILARVAVRLWRSASGEASVARARMRTISLASTGMAIAVLISGIGSAQLDVDWTQVVTRSISVVAALMFWLGFAPPGILRSWWRKPEEARLREAALQFMEAETEEEVRGVLLPLCVRLTGGKGAFIVDDGGSITAPYGLSEAEAAAVVSEGQNERIITLPMRNGSLWVRSSAYVPYFGPEEASLVGTLATMGDLAFDRCELLSRERKAREQMEEAQEIAAVGSWEWDVRQDKITWSPQLYRMYEIEPEESAPTYDDYLDVVHPDDREAMAATVRHTMETHEPFDLEHRIVSPTGKVTYNHARGRVVLDADGHVTRLIGTGHDITERKQHELFRERFIANAAHELRTPLTSLLGLIEVLSARREAMADEQIDEAIEVMSRGGRRLARLVNNLLDLTKLQEGQQVRAVPVHLGSVVHEVLGANPPPEDRLLQVDIEEGLRVMGDPEWLDQIFSNLFSNAYKYGGMNIRVRAERSPSGVLIRVSDDGTGVDPKIQGSLFEPFRRGESFQSVIGSGLGLALVKMVVEVLGGSLWYEDAAPGACFCVLLKEAA